MSRSFQASCLAHTVAGPYTSVRPYTWVKSNPIFSMPSIIEAGGAAPATMAFTPAGTPTFIASEALTSRPCTMGAPQ